MWEFVEHKFVEPARWTWSRVGNSGRVYQRSPAAYQSLGNAIAGAMLYGFDGTKDQFRLIELEARSVPDRTLEEVTRVY
jgi:hypothetical protein